MSLKDNWFVVLSAWAITAVVLGVYASVVLRRARALSERVRPDRRRWVTSK